MVQCTRIIRWICILMCSVCLIITLATYSYMKSKVDITPSLRSDFINISLHNTSNQQRVMTILYWTTYYGTKYWYGEGSEPFKDCPFSRCSLTWDKGELHNASALLFNMRDIRSVENLPKGRQPDQTWIMWMKESPVHAFISYTPFNHRFNASMTYKKASDIYLPQFEFAPNSGPVESTGNVNYASGRNRLVAWFVSNCHTNSQREKYVAELKRYIDVDIYGKCGPLKCPKLPSKSELSCDDQLQKNYKFYLSFENSICKEYFTEKLERSYELNVVPVVLGGANYSTFLPPHSYIDVKRFTSPKQLADYLLTLDKDDALYNEYFGWKEHYQMKQIVPKCLLCEYVHKHQGKHSTLNRPDLFWNKDTDCTTADDYYHGIVKR